MEVVLLFRRGPLEGKQIPLRLGRVTLGREPGPEGVTLPRDHAVSRQHGELYVEDGQVVYRNLSVNGTIVNRKIVQETRVLAPGDELGFGSDHLVEVRFRAAARKEPEEEAGEKGLLSSGPLRNPVVRVVLIAYLVGLVAVVVWVKLQGGSSAERAFQRVREAYSAGYQPEGVPEEELTARLEQAEVLVRKLTTFERTENWTEARAACRELMALDADPQSPLYRFGARRLGDLAHRR